MSEFHPLASSSRAAELIGPTRLRSLTEAGNRNFAGRYLEETTSA